mmetsp:Transcript_516/g.1155  ORF Transcript_516/g.1155 Transcript_516/m.1155 type:complete len:106 (+) Transcript_516:2-319(+)
MGGMFRGVGSAAAVCAARPAFMGSAVQVAPVGPSAGPSMLISVNVGDSEPIESALRRFKKEVLKSGHLMEVRKRQRFVSNSAKRQVLMAARKRRAKMNKLHNVDV